MSTTDPKAPAIDHIDRIHDMLSSKDGTSALQAHVEGILDRSLTEAIHFIGRDGGEPDDTRVMIVLNHVGRTLRDAYGHEMYAMGVLAAQTDLYEKGVVETTAMATEAMERVTSAIEEATPAIVARLEAANRNLALAVYAGGVAGMLGTCISVATVLGALWYTGGITFH
jgi:hypothetical protein